jgi:hypothetical protein
MDGGAHINEQVRRAKRAPRAVLDGGCWDSFAASDPRLACSETGARGQGARRPSWPAPDGARCAAAVRAPRGGGASGAPARSRTVPGVGPRVLAACGRVPRAGRGVAGLGGGRGGVGGGLAEGGEARSVEPSRTLARRGLTFTGRLGRPRWHSHASRLDWRRRLNWRGGSCLRVSPLADGGRSA